MTDLEKVSFFFGIMLFIFISLLVPICIGFAADEQNYNRRYKQLNYQNKYQYFIIF